MLFFIGTIVAAEYAELPLISELSPQNHIFQQYSDDVLYARKALAAGKTARELPLQFYRYKVQKEDTIIRIAARCSMQLLPPTSAYEKARLPESQPIMQVSILQPQPAAPYMLVRRGRLSKLHTAPFTAIISLFVTMTAGKVFMGI